jgi:hypothetical protein
LKELILKISLIRDHGWQTYSFLIVTNLLLFFKTKFQIQMWCLSTNHDNCHRKKTSPENAYRCFFIKKIISLIFSYLTICLWISGERPFKCKCFFDTCKVKAMITFLLNFSGNICERSYATEAGLTGHVQTNHTLSNCFFYLAFKYYSYRFDGFFNYSIFLPVRYECNFCDKKLALKISMWKHIFSHRG